MTTDPWQHMLEQIQPDYKHWRDLLDESAVFVANIHKLENFGKLGWRINYRTERIFLS